MAVRSLAYSLASVAVAGLLAASQAQAALKLTADVSGTTFSCTDGQACDNNPLPGFLGIGTVSTPQVVNGVEVYASLSVGDTVGSVSFLNSSSSQIINQSEDARFIRLAVSATDFDAGAGTNNVAVAGAGTFLFNVGQALAMSYFADDANTQGADTATDTPGVLLSSFTQPVGSSPEAYSHTDSTNPVSLTGLYSMTQYVEFGLARDSIVGEASNGGRLVNRGQSMVATNGVTPNPEVSVPEPASLALFGAGLIGLGLVRRRRQKNV